MPCRSNYANALDDKRKKRCERTERPTNNHDSLIFRRSERIAARKNIV